MGRPPSSYQHLLTQLALFHHSPCLACTLPGHGVRISKSLPRILDQGFSQANPNSWLYWKTLKAPGPHFNLEWGEISSQWAGSPACHSLYPALVSSVLGPIYFHMGTAVFCDEKEREIFLWPHISQQREMRDGQPVLGKLVLCVIHFLCPPTWLCPGLGLLWGYPQQPNQATFHSRSF